MQLDSTSRVRRDIVDGCLPPIWAPFLDLPHRRLYFFLPSISKSTVEAVANGPSRPLSYTTRV
jgi:hypothetical protein